MCGIAGWFGPAPADPDGVLETAGRVLAHRGPDSGGTHRGPSHGLAFRRLAILDLSSTGDQPMGTPDGRFCLVLNGEVYNHVELRRELVARGVRFVGTSDTEVLLHLLALDGVEALTRCNGMFAFAFLDLRTRRFVLGRDRLGVKPLFYSVLPSGRLQFGSELKAVLAAPDVRRDLDEPAVAAYLALGVVPGDACALSGCHKLPPAHVMEGDLDEPVRHRVRRYWSLELCGEEPADLGELEMLLGDAVRVRLRSDVPVGVFLSSGIDSGLVAALAARAARAGGGAAPSALTVGFEVGSYDESPLAAATARWIGLPHRVVPQAGDALALLDRLAWHFDEPFGDTSALPCLQLAEAARRWGVVWLSGDGGDEAFAGYRRYLRAQRFRALQLLPSGLGSAVRQVARALPDTSPWRYRAVKATAPWGGVAAAFDSSPEDPALAAVAGPALRPHLAPVAERLWEQWRATSGRPLLARQQALDYNAYLPDDILVKADRSSMAHGIEVRSPFLDVRVVEWAARRSRDALVAGSHSKIPLRALAASLLPPEVLHAGKRGFEPPVDAWLRTGRGRALVRERLLADDAGHGLWQPGAVHHLLEAHGRSRGRPFGELLWRLLVLESWHRQYRAGAFLAGPPTSMDPALSRPRSA